MDGENPVQRHIKIMANHSDLHVTPFPFPHCQGNSDLVTLHDRRWISRVMSVCSAALCLAKSAQDQMSHHILSKRGGVKYSDEILQVLHSGKHCLIIFDLLNYMIIYKTCIQALGPCFWRQEPSSAGELAPCYINAHEELSIRIMLVWLEPLYWAWA